MRWPSNRADRADRPAAGRAARPGRALARCAVVALLSAGVLAGCTAAPRAHRTATPAPTVTAAPLVTTDLSMRRTRATAVAAQKLSGRVLYAGPAVLKSSSCSESLPCPLNGALLVARAGDTVLLESGSYDNYTVTAPASFGSFAENVVVQPAPGAHPSFERIFTFAPHITWRHITVHTLFYIKPSAHDTWFDQSEIVHGGAFLKSDHVTVTDSLFEHGESIDGMQIGGADDVLVEGNTVRDFNQDGTTGYHADCLQLFDSHDITIRQNRFGNCYNSSITFSGGAQLGLANVLIESNFLGGCAAISHQCDRGTAIDLREKSATNVTLRGNTLLGGGTRIVPLPGLVVDRNIFSYLSTCSFPMSNSIVENWNRGLCATIPMVGMRGNRVGDVAVKDLATDDFHPLHAAEVKISPWGHVPRAALDYDGKPTVPSAAGAAN